MGVSLQIILLGDSAVGKSKLIERYLLDNYHPRQRSTFALTLYRHNVPIEVINNNTSTPSNSCSSETTSSQSTTSTTTTPSSSSSSSPTKKANVAIDFWDTAGQERFASMHPSYYYKAHACVLVFDVTRKVTYQNLQNWYKELRMYCETIPCICIANKIDVDMRVTSKAFAFPQKYNLPFYFVSAADGTNVVKIFEEAVRLAYQYKYSAEKDFVSEVLEMLDDKALGAFGRALYGPNSPTSPNNHLTNTTTNNNSNNNSNTLSTTTPAVQHSIQSLTSAPSTTSNVGVKR